MPLMSLGMFIFAMDSVPYETLSRKTNWRFGRSERVGAHAAAQFLGPGEETISIAGMLAPPVVGDYGNLRVLKEMGSSGDALDLVDSEGVVHGRFTIESIDEKQSYILDGGVPRKVDFTLELKRVERPSAEVSSTTGLLGLFR